MINSNSGKLYTSIVLTFSFVLSHFICNLFFNDCEGGREVESAWFAKIMQYNIPTKLVGISVFRIG